MEIDFKKIESKWQKRWEKAKAFEVRAFARSPPARPSAPSAQTKVSSQKRSKSKMKKEDKPKFYVLEMFPYPSASRLHMGHALNYSIGDVFARFKRMNGFNVLYPMGFDSMGLPAENAAIKAGEHPKPFTKNAISNFMRQMKEIGLSYDWSKTLATMDPEYYKWNQFFFLKFLEKGLVYRKKAPVNWCPKCSTVLANEQVQNGKCWRHEDTEVGIKHLEQWFMKTTNYADELLDCLDDLNWPDKIKSMQKNWIGKSYGTEIDFEVETPKGNDKISNVVIVHGSPRTKNLEAISPDKKHWRPWIKDELMKKEIKCVIPLMPKPWEPVYEDWKKKFEKNKIDENSILIGHSAGTAFLVRWLGETKKKIKKLILIAPAKLTDEEIKRLKDFCNFNIDKSIKNRVKEIVVFVSNDNQRIIDSAKLYSRELGGKLIELEGRGHFIEKHMRTKEFPELLEEIVSSQKTKFPIFTTRPDTIYGVTFMVISAQHERLMDFVTAEQKKEVEKFLKKLRSVSEKEMEDLEKEGVFTGSYAINPMTKDRVPIYAGNFVVADYGSGMVMAVPAHDQRDFEFAKKYEIPIKVVISPFGQDVVAVKKMPSAYTTEGILINSEKFNGMENKKAKEEITKFLVKKGIGRKTVNYKLRDWGFSRQRYWGTPIPIIVCEKCGRVPVPEKDLPVKLPEKVKFGKGNPLETNEKWLKVKCPKCGGNAKRETDTMDTFFDSSWYYLRYPDNKNSQKPFEKKNVDYWLPVDQYIGGAEHACMHLIYARFFTKALRDLGYLNFDEPFTSLFNQGMLHGEDGEKMSKSKGNVINPDEVSQKYGMDTARLFLLSLALPDKPRDWSEAGINGSLKFVKKVFEKFEKIKIGKSSAKIESKLNKAIKEVTNHIESFKYNLAIIKVRDLFNSLGDEESKEVLEKSLKLLSPFCPHIAEELWEKLDHKTFISLQEWPKVEERKIDESLERQDEMVKKLNSDIENVKKLIGKENAKVYVYVLPNELEIYKNVKGINLFAVNDAKKYDPENKSKKVKPNKPGIYLE